MRARKISILDPFSGPRTELNPIAPRTITVAGKKLGVLSNGWRSFDHMIKRYSSLAVEKYEASEVLTRKNPNSASSTPEQTMTELTERCDAVIVGIGH